MTTIGIDNGTTGTVGIIHAEGALFEAVPSRETLHYAKAKGFVHRIDRGKLHELLAPYCSNPSQVRVYVEQPFTMAFATPSVLLAHRAYEAVLSVCEDLHVGVETITPRDWQPHVLGKITAMKTVKGKPKADTKKASMLRGVELYPQLRAGIEKHGDADGLLIAHYYNSFQQLS